MPGPLLLLFFSFLFFIFMSLSTSTYLFPMWQPGLREWATPFDHPRRSSFAAAAHDSGVMTWHQADPEDGALAPISSRREGMVVRAPDAPRADPVVVPGDEECARCRCRICTSAYLLNWMSIAVLLFCVLFRRL